MYDPLTTNVVNDECCLASRELFECFTDCIVDVRLSGQSDIVNCTTNGIDPFLTVHPFESQPHNVESWHRGVHMRTLPFRYSLNDPFACHCCSGHDGYCTGISVCYVRYIQ